MTDHSAGKVESHTVPDQESDNEAIEPLPERGDIETEMCEEDTNR